MAEPGGRTLSSREGLRGRLAAFGIAPYLQALALACALVPIIVGVARAWSSGLVPISDNAWFLARSRDVLTDDHPFLGAWSAGSRTIEAWVNNLGPLYVELMAPFTRIAAYRGAAAGVGFINAAAVVGVWFAARRLMGTWGVVIAMAGTLALEMVMGPLGLIQARQQLALILPFWCLLWLVAALWRGAAWTLPWVVFVASLILQTHFTYVYQTVALLGAGLVAFFVNAGPPRRSPSTWRWIGVAAVVGVLCWLQPLWDQFFGTGNMGVVLRESGGNGEAAGLGAGVRLVADSVLVPPFFAPWTMAEFREGPLLPSSWAWLTVIAWLAVLIAVFAHARGRDRRLSAMAGTGTIALITAVYAAASIPPNSNHGLVPQNYFWMWPIGVFLMTTVVVAIVDVVKVMSERPVRPLHSGVRYGAPGVALAALTIVAALAPLGWTKLRHEQETSIEFGLPLLSQLRTSLDRHDVEGPVLIDWSRARPGNITFRYLVFTELQQQGIDYTFPPGDTNLARFGMRRCDDGSANHRIVFADGPAAGELQPGEQLLARIGDMHPRGERRLAELEDQFRQHLLDGTVSLNTERIDERDESLHSVLTRFLDDGDTHADSLALLLTRRYQEGLVSMPPSLEPQFKQWLRLSQASYNRNFSIILAPYVPPAEAPCDELGPPPTGSAREPG